MNGQGIRRFTFAMVSAMVLPAGTVMAQSTPTTTFKAYYEAGKKKDVAALRKGNTAALEVYDASNKTLETMHFVKENGEWKITMEKQ